MGWVVQQADNRKADEAGLHKHYLAASTIDREKPQQDKRTLPDKKSGRFLCFS